MAKSAPVRIIFNATIAQLVEPEREVRLQVSEILSYKVAGAEHMGKPAGWDGCSSFFKMRQNQFPSGFVRLVKKRLERLGHRVITKCKDAPTPLGPEHPVVDDFPEDPRYDYQEDVMRRLLSLRGMIAQVATGGGKSRIFKLCCERIGRPTLFVTTRKSLMWQMADAYKEDLKKPAGILGDGKWDPYLNGANFAIVDTLTSRLEEMTVKGEMEKAAEKLIMEREAKVEQALKKLKLPTNPGLVRNLPEGLKKKIEAVRARVYDAMPIDDEALQKKIEVKVKRHTEKRTETIALLKRMEFVCLEEAHEVSGNGYFDIMNHCTNAVYRLALTATPFMKDDEASNMRLMAVTGTIGIKVSEKLLIERGILATPYFKYADPGVGEKVYRSTGWQRAYQLGVVEHKKRNRIIVQECKKARRYGLPVMILVQHSKHGIALEKTLNATGIKTKFIYGKHEQRDRAAALVELGNGGIDVLIGSTILDVGVDVPAVGLVVLAGGGKAEVALRQRIGRGLRAKKAGPNVCFVLDFEDRGNNHLVRHARERRRIVDETPGFAENVGKHFDYEGVGFTLRGAAA